jgi:hypothetical protein
MGSEVSDLTKEEVEQLIEESTWLLNMLHNEWGGCEILCAQAEPVLHRLTAERYKNDKGN